MKHVLTTQQLAEPKQQQRPHPSNAQFVVNDELTDAEIASVMNPARLQQLLQRANAFAMVNSEDLDDF